MILSRYSRPLDNKGAFTPLRAIRRGLLILILGTFAFICYEYVDRENTSQTYARFSTRTNPLTFIALALATLAVFKRNSLNSLTATEAYLWASSIFTISLFPLSRPIIASFTDRDMGATGWNTAISLGLIAVSQCLRFRAKSFALTLNVMAGLMPLLALEGLMFRERSLYGEMAATTSIALLLLNLSSLSRLFRHALILPIFKRGMSGDLVRSQIIILLLGGAVLPIFYSASSNVFFQNLPLVHILTYLCVLILVFTVGFYFSYQNQSVQSERQRYRYQALHDPLTGAMNRRAISDNLFKNSHAVYAVMVVDIDNFKAINDHYGHIFADNVLIEVVNKINSTIGTNDTIIRWGGDEFIIIFTADNSQKAIDLVNDIKEKICSVTIDRKNLECSAGVCFRQPKESVTVLECISHADSELKKVKKYGKNRISCCTNRIEDNTVISINDHREKFIASD
ncbi:GGDEF domain-containing protein [Thioclava kandeliae]|uniref:diguanylate cyclase n=1 Tax=Thioclava kandeliae TaxID=3070818 RepID=A0ABV1SNB6_9RHOB